MHLPTRRQYRCDASNTPQHFGYRRYGWVYKQSSLSEAEERIESTLFRHELLLESNLRSSENLKQRIELNTKAMLDANELR